jgi:Zn-dependent protease/CBS domain-containing protein
MKGGINLGKIFGIRVTIDWSWLLIFLLITWNLASNVFPAIHPDWSPGLNWLIGLAASLLFFLSVLAHELAHSLVAVSQGLPVRQITLFMFGGVSNIEREPNSPRSEFYISIVGPLTSLVIGVVFFLLGSSGLGRFSLPIGTGGPDLQQLDPISTLLLWLGPINIILAVFNMVPGFPLDGGRVLRSIFWAITNDLRKATRWASWIGQVIAWTFILAGISMVFGIRIPFLGSGVFSGLWLVFIGWFLNNAAVQAYQQVVVKEILEGIPVSQLMRPDTPTVPSNTTISQLMDDYVMKSDEHSFPVLDGERLVGLVSLDDIRRVPRDQWDRVTIDQVMTPAEKLEVVKPGEESTDALEKLVSKNIRQLPVIQDGKLVGVLRRTDILRWLQANSAKV